MARRARPACAVAFSDATKKRCDDLMRAYLRGLGATRSCERAMAEAQDRYLRVTWATRTRYQVRPTSGCKTRAHCICVTSPMTALSSAKSRNWPRGRAAVICNTVRRAQEVYEALRPFFPGDADDGLPVLDLLYVRYSSKTAPPAKRAFSSASASRVAKSPTGWHHASSQTPASRCAHL